MTRVSLESLFFFRVTAVRQQLHGSVHSRDAAGVGGGDVLTYIISYTSGCVIYNANTSDNGSNPWQRSFMPVASSSHTCSRRRPLDAYLRHTRHPPPPRSLARHPGHWFVPVPRNMHRMCNIARGGGSGGNSPVDLFFFFFPLVIEILSSKKSNKNVTPTRPSIKCALNVLKESDVFQRGRRNIYALKSG